MKSNKIAKKYIYPDSQSNTDLFDHIPRKYSSYCYKIAEENPIIPYYHPHLAHNNQKSTAIQKSNKLQVLGDHIFLKRSKSLSYTNYSKPTKNFICYQKLKQQKKQKLSKRIRQSLEKLQPQIQNINKNCQANNKIKRRSEKKNLKPLKKYQQCNERRNSCTKYNKNEYQGKRRLSRGSRKSIQSIRSHNLKGINFIKSMSLKSLKSMMSTQYMSKSSCMSKCQKKGQKITENEQKMSQIYQRCKQTIEAYQLKVRALERENLSLRTQNNLLKSVQ